MDSRGKTCCRILWTLVFLFTSGPLLAGAARTDAPRSVGISDGISLSRIDRTIRTSPIMHDGPNNILTVPVPYATITAAMAAAANGDIIQIAAGTYVENVVINKSVEIAGAGALLTIIVPQVSGPNPGGGGSMPPGSSNMMIVQADNVTIHDLTLNGDNPALTSGIVVGGADLDARNGIITNHTLGVYNNLVVYNVTVKNIYLRGIYASSGGTFNFHHNTIQNVQAEYASIAMFNFGGSGVFANNVVSDANDAISANWSTGTQFLNNTITNSGSGVHTDNNTAGPDLIQGNIVSNSQANGYGVWVFFPYVNTVLNNNTITNCDVGLFAWGGAGGTGTFTGNVVNGQGRTSCIGAYATPGTDAWGSYQSNVVASFSGNTVQNTAWGFVVESDEATPFFSNTLTVASHATSGNTTDIWVTGLGPITVSGLSGNTVLVTAPARIQDGIDLAAAGGTVTVGSGSFDCPIDIQKPLTLLGQGIGVTNVDRSANASAGTVVSIHNLSGNVLFDGFTIKTGPASTVASNGISISNLTGPGTITVSHNEIWGVQSAAATAQVNYTVIAGYFTVTTPRLVFDQNTVHGGSDNPVLIEKWMGPTEITNNILFQNPLKDFSASDVIFMMNYGGTHNTQKQLISGNTIDMGWGTTNQRGAGISVASSYTGGTSPGGFTDVEITNNTLSNLKPNRRGISIWNNSSDGPGGDITNAVISGNTISNAVSFTGEFGIRVLGKATGTTIANNAVSGVIDAVKIQPWNGHQPSGTMVHGNSLLATTYGLNNSSTATVDASGNWWGDNSAGGVASKISANGDYTPWLNAGTDMGDPGFQGDFSNLWVSASSPQVGSAGRIQEALSMVTGSTVNVTAGLYTESVNLTTANLSLLGEGASTTTINPGSSAVNCISIAANGCTISGFTLTGGQNGIAGTTASSKIKNCTITGNSQDGVHLVDADFNVVQGNTIANHTAGVGVLLLGSKQNSVAGNTIQNNNFNVQIALNGTRAARGNLVQGNNLLNPGTWSVNVNNEPRTTKVNFNVFSPADKYVRNSTSSLTQKVDATYNWFGGEATPLASHFSGPVDYTHNYATDPTVAVMPASYYLPTGTTATLNVMALLPAGIFVRGVDVTLGWTNDTQVPDVGDPAEGSFFSSFASRLYVFDRPTASSVRINSAILGPTTGAGNPTGGLPYVGTIFAQDFQGLADGTSTLTLSGVQLRDPDNNPITPIGVDPPGGAQLIVDGSAPGVTGVLIDNTSIDNDNFVKNTDNVTVTATVTDASPLAAEDITADLSGFYGGAGHTADNPSSYVAGVATWTVSGVSCTPADGAITVGVSALDPAGNLGTGSDNITADNTVPTAPTAFVARTVSPGGHGKAALSWTAGTDANYRGVAIRYNSWTYPAYPAGSPPSYPATPLEGTAVSATPIPGTSTEHVVAARNVYYYSAFAADWAGNYSVLDVSGTDRSANYYLGDLGSGTGAYIPGSGGYNGLVNYEDLFWLSRLYFSSAPGWTVLDPNAAESDFGPTVANKTYPAGHRFGIARPDGRIDFEDLMIFSMNYYNVLPKIEPPQNKVIARELVLGLTGNNRAVGTGEEFVVAVHLANDGRGVKGTSVTVKFDPAVVQVTGVEAGPLFGTSGQGFFAHEEGTNTIRIDQAVLGIDRTVDYSGDLAFLHFRGVQPGEARITIQAGTVRDGENGSISPTLQDETVELPTTFALEQNYPNPFNPTTTIRYQVPVAAHVELTVFNIIGEKVGTLVNEVQEPGYYNVVWSSRTVASGTYFYVLRAGEFTSIKKMVVVK